MLRIQVCTRPMFKHALVPVLGHKLIMLLLSLGMADSSVSDNTRVPIANSSSISCSSWNVSASFDGGVCQISTTSKDDLTVTFCNRTKSRRCRLAPAGLPVTSLKVHCESEIKPESVSWAVCGVLARTFAIIALGAGLQSGCSKDHVFKGFHPREGSLGRGRQMPSSYYIKF